MSSPERSSQFTKALFGLRSLVMSGEFESQARLPETALAERLEVSRTPLRQAIAQLVEEGLLERLETGGCRLASLSMADIIDSIEIRGVIEGTAARLAAERGADPELAAECRLVLDGLDAALADPGQVDFDSYVTLNARFHVLVSRLAGSDVVAREVDRISRLPLASPSSFLQEQELISEFQASLQLAQHQHRAIFSAIMNREGARAEAQAREHARLARQNLEFVMRSRPNLVQKVPGLALVSP